MSRTSHDAINKIDSIALTGDDKQGWLVNRDNDSASVLNVEGDVNTKLAEIPFGDEPRCVALTLDNQNAYINSTVSGTVSVINANTRQVINPLRSACKVRGPPYISD